jgi:hypothetical protein
MNQHVYEEIIVTKVKCQNNRCNHIWYYGSAERAAIESGAECPECGTFAQFSQVKHIMPAMPKVNPA